MQPVKLLVGFRDIEDQVWQQIESDMVYITLTFLQEDVLDEVWEMFDIICQELEMWSEDDM